MTPKRNGFGGTYHEIRFDTKDEQLIAEEAARNCRTEMQKMGWSAASTGSIKPVFGDGVVGLESNLGYVNIQNRGWKPFLMHWVEGRTVPIKDKGTGQTNFVRGGQVGQPGWVTLPGGVRKWRDQKWRNPGSKPKNFMEKALNKAIKKHRPRLLKRIKDALMGVYHD